MKKLLLIALSTAMLLSISGCGNNSELEQLRKENEELKQQLQESEAPSAVNTDAAYTLTAGDYDIPGDVAEGKYNVVCTSGTGVFNVHDPENGYVISVTMNITKEYGITERKNASLKSGQTINITGTLTVDLISTGTQEQTKGEQQATPAPTFIANTSQQESQSQSAAVEEKPQQNTENKQNNTSSNSTGTNSSEETKKQMQAFLDNFKNEYPDTIIKTEAYSEGVFSVWFTNDWYLLTDEEKEYFANNFYSAVKNQYLTVSGKSDGLISLTFYDQNYKTIAKSKMLGGMELK